VPDHDPEAVHEVAFEEAHVKSTEVSIFTEDSPETKLEITAASA